MLYLSSYYIYHVIFILYIIWFDIANCISYHFICIIIICWIKLIIPYLLHTILLTLCLYFILYRLILLFWLILLFYFVCVWHPTRQPAPATQHPAPSTRCLAVCFMRRDASDASLFLLLLAFYLFSLGFFFAELLISGVVAKLTWHDPIPAECGRLAKTCGGRQVNGRHVAVAAITNRNPTQPKGRKTNAEAEPKQEPEGQSARNAAVADGE